MSIRSTCRTWSSGARPWAEREAAFATLRRESPITHYDEPVIEGTAIEFPVGNGFYAITKYRDVQTASRHPEIFLSGPGRGLDDGPAQ